VTTSTASNQAPFASAFQPQPSAISTLLQTHNRDFNSKASWPRQLQMPTLTSNSSTSSISIPSTSPSETTIGNPTNAVIKISKPYLVMQSARKPLLCQRKTIAALSLPVKTSRALPPMENLLQPSPRQALSNNPT